MTRPAIDPRQKTGPVEATHPITGVPWDAVRAKNKRLENRLDKQAVKQGWEILSDQASEHFFSATISDTQRCVELIFFKTHSFSHARYYGGQEQVIKLNQEEAERVIAGASCTCAGLEYWNGVVTDPDCAVHQ